MEAGSRSAAAYHALFVEGREEVEEEVYQEDVAGQLEERRILEGREVFNDIEAEVDGHKNDLEQQLQENEDVPAVLEEGGRVDDELVSLEELNPLLIVLAEFLRDSVDVFVELGGPLAREVVLVEVVAVVAGVVVDHLELLLGKPLEFQPDGQEFEVGDEFLHYRENQEAGRLPHHPEVGVLVFVAALVGGRVLREQLL